MKKIFKIILWVIIAIVLLNVAVNITARYGWKLFGFQYCERVEPIYVQNIEVSSDTVTLNGGVMESASAFVGSTYEIVGDKLYIGLKYNVLFGFSQRIGTFNISLKTDTSKITQIFLKDAHDEKQIWSRTP